MKRIALLALAAVFALPLFAQEEEEWDNVVYASANDVVRFEMLSSFGYGFHLLNSPDFQSRMSDEYFVNIATLGIHPIDALGIELGIDLVYNSFGSRTHAFMQSPDGLIQSLEFTQLEQGTLDRHYGSFDVLSLNAPLLIKCKAGSFWIGGGAVGSLNCLGRTFYSYRQNYREVSVTERRAKINTFTYGLVATVGYNGFGVYFKYYPKTSRLLPEGSVDFNYMTIGCVYDF